MTVITFDDNLITGNKTIDEQHKELIDRIQQFVSACESEDARVKAIKMLDYLDEYTEFHFKEEEKLQKDVDYPGLEEHIKKHESSGILLRNSMIIWMKMRDQMKSLWSR